MRKGHLAILLLLAACKPEPISLSNQLTLWTEFMEADEIADRVSFAAEHQINLNVAIIEEEHARPYLAELCRIAEENDVPIRLWPLLTKAKGYWANQENYTAFATHTRLITSWAKEDCPRVNGVVVDLEMSVNRLEHLRELFSTGASNLEIISFLGEKMDDQRFEIARSGFARLVEDLSADGFVVSATALPMLVDDFADEDETIAKALLTPINGIPWQTVSFQVYRSTFNSFFASTTTTSEGFDAGLVSSYAKTIEEELGQRGGVDLGTTGSGVMSTTGMQEPVELQSDIAAALDAGIPVERIAVYSLEGLDDESDRAAWLRIPAPRGAPANDLTKEVRELLRELDATLD